MSFESLNWVDCWDFWRDYGDIRRLFRTVCSGWCGWERLIVGWMDEWINLVQGRIYSRWDKLLDDWLCWRLLICRSVEGMWLRGSANHGMGWMRLIVVEIMDFFWSWWIVGCRYGRFLYNAYCWYVEVKATVRIVGLLGDRQWGMNFQDQIWLIGEFDRLGRYT